MTITAIQPFYRAGVLIAAGPTQLSYSASDEADLVRRGVAAYVGSNPQISTAVPAMVQTNATTGATELLGPGGVIGVPYETALGSGIYQANLVPRRDLLATLLVSTAGGVGEISEATDWDALVLHNGVVGGAKILYCKPKTVQVVAFTPQNIANTTNVPLSFFQAVDGMENTGIWASGAPTVFNVPTAANRVRVTANCGFAFHATGSRSIALGDNASPPNSIASIGKGSAHPTAGTFINGSLVAEISGRTVLTVIALQDSGGALTTDANPFVRVNLEFFVA